MSGIVIDATAQRCGKWWAVEFHTPNGPRATQARRLDEIEAMVRDLCELDDVAVAEVHVSPVFPEKAEVERSREATKQAAEATAAASKTSRDLVARLRAQGMPIRDVAVLLGVSPQRVSQLAK